MATRQEGYTGDSSIVFIMLELVFLFIRYNLYPTQSRYEFYSSLSTIWVWNQGVSSSHGITKAENTSNFQFYLPTTDELKLR